MRILLAEDDPPTLRLISKILASTDYEVLLASDGKTAWRLIQGQRPHVVITDWAMPGLDGVRLCRRIRERDSAKYTYVILLTVKSREEDIVRALDAGADDFITKPVTPAMLMARLRAGIRVLEMEYRLRRCSERDPLTDSLNRRAFFRQVDHEWARATYSRQPLSCVLVDVDFFKGFNDSYGHAAGDRILRTLARLLERHCRSLDIVCRYGGEEFCVLLPETDEAGAVAWAERARNSLMNLDLVVGKEIVVRTTASFGVAQRNENMKTPQELTALADRALAVAKSSGRNRVTSYRSVSLSSSTSSCEPARRPLEDVLARDVMTANVLCLQLDDPVACVAETLLHVRLDSAPVVDRDGRLVGVVSTRDLLASLARSRGGEKRIHNIMRKDVVCHEETAPAHEVAEYLFRSAAGAVVIVRDDRPVGTISVGTLLRWCHNWAAARPSDSQQLGHSTAPHHNRVEHEDTIRLVEIAVRQLCQFRRELIEGMVAPMPRVVGEATNLQELANDLLGCQQTMDAGLVL